MNKETDKEKAGGVMRKVESRKWELRDRINYRYKADRWSKEAQG